MAPVEIDSIPRDNVVTVAPNEDTKDVTAHYKIVDKMFQLPLVSDTYNEVQKLVHTTGIDSTISPLVETVATTIKTTAEENILPRIPEDLTSKIQSNVAYAVDTIDTLACDGVDMLTGKLPVLKEPVPELIDTTKGAIVTGATQTAEYLASFQLAQLALKVVDYELNTVDTLLKNITGCDEKNMIIGGIETLRDETATVRKAGVLIAGTEKAKKIEDSSLVEAIAEVTGFTFLFSTISLLVLTVIPSWIVGVLPVVGKTAGSKVEYEITGEIAETIQEENACCAKECCENKECCVKKECCEKEVCCT